jgi:hypothetical protein
MEFVTMERETVVDIEATAVEILTADAPLKKYVVDVKNGIDPLEAATKNPRKDPKNKIINEKDERRDKAISRFGRRLYYFELSEDPDERAAFETLEPLWIQHRDILSMNKKNQTGSTDNFINDLKKEPFASAVTTLTMSPEQNAIEETNNDFRASESDKRSVKTTHENVKAKDLRKTLESANNNLCEYVYVMAKAYPDNAQWNKLLTVINVIRKRYSELLVHRQAHSKKKPDKTDDK